MDQQEYERLVTVAGESIEQLPEGKRTRLLGQLASRWLWLEEDWRAFVRELTLEQLMDLAAESTRRIREGS